MGENDEELDEKYRQKPKNNNKEKTKLTNPLSPVKVKIVVWCDVRATVTFDFGTAAPIKRLLLSDFFSTFRSIYL